MRIQGGFSRIENIGLYKPISLYSGPVNVYSSSNDFTVRKIDPDGNQVWSFTGHTDNAWGVAVDPGLYGAGFWS